MSKATKSFRFIVIHNAFAVMAAFIIFAIFGTSSNAFAQAVTERATAEVIMSKDKLQTATEPDGLPSGSIASGEAIGIVGGVELIQTGTYVFSATTASLEDMSIGTTNLVAAGSDDGLSAITPLGFDFWYDGTRYTQFSITANGLLKLGSTPIAGSFGAFSNGLAAAADSPKIAPYWDDLWVGSNGQVHYKVVGSAPNRKLVVEWQNMTIPRQTTVTTGNGTFQLWLSETTGAIQFVYGNGMAANSANSGYSVGLQSGVATNFASVTTAADTVSYATANNTQSDAITAGKSYLFSYTQPTDPTGLSFTAVTASSITLNWTDNATNESGYSIYRSLDGTNYSLVLSTAANAVSATDTGLIPGVNYFYRVYAAPEGASSVPLAGNQATLAAGEDTCNGAGGNWDATSTWTDGSVPTSTDNVTIGSGCTVTVNVTNATAYNVTVSSGGTLQSPSSGTVTNNNLTVVGNVTNNGTLDFSTNANTSAAILTFGAGVNNVSFGGTGATTDVRAITVAKGAQATIVELNPTNFTVQGVTTDSAGFLTLTSGTFKVSGSFTVTNRIFTAAGYSIPAAGGLWMNNPNFTVAGQNGSPTVTGLFRMTQGTYNIGTATGNSMGFATGANINVEGGAINATGRFGVAAAGNVITYTQSGGTITVCTIGNASGTLGSFDLGGVTTTTLASVINISGGTIVVQIPATTIDYRNQSGTGITGVTGGTLQLGNANSVSARVFSIRGVVPNLVLDNTIAGHSASWSTTLVNYNNISRNITINSGTTLNLGNVVFLFYGTTLTNNGTLTHNGTSSNTVMFTDYAPVSYTGTGTVTAPLSNLAFQTTQGFTIDPASSNIVANAVRLFNGNVINSSKLIVGNGGATTAVVQIGNTTTPTAAGTFDSQLGFNPGSGGTTLNYLRTSASRATGFEVPTARTVTAFAYDDNDTSHTLTIAGGDLTVTGATALTNGRVVTGANTLISDSAGSVTRTTGYVDGNFKKIYTAAGSKLYEVGTANGYSPATVNVTSASAFPADVTAKAVQTAQPNIGVPGKALSRYWKLTGPTITGASLTFTYQTDTLDVPVTATESNFAIQKHDGMAFSQPAGTIDTSLNTFTVPSTSSLSDWTLAEPSALVAPDADVAITKSNGGTTVTAGGSTTYTITASNAGPSATTATVADTFPGTLSGITWTCLGTGGASCATSGSGNINDTTVNLPVGGVVTYTANATVSSAATGTLANTATVTVTGAGVTDPNAANNSATDTDTIGQSADLGITKTDGVSSATPGGSVTYTIVASNAGPSDTTATVADTLPASLTGSWTCVGIGGGSCTAGPVAGNINDAVTLPAGGSVTYTVNATISASATGTLSNTATVSGAATDPTPGNNSATDTDTLQASANLSITKTNGVASVTAGGSTTYTITASNAGPSNATATVADTLPAELTATWTCVGAGSGTCTASGSGNISDAVTLPAGGSVTYTVSATISASATGTLSNTATVAIGGAGTDPVPANNSATDSDPIGQAADLSITKTDGVGQYLPGGTVTYTITALNAGPSNVPSAAIVDNFPAQVTGVNWTCTGAGGGVCTGSGTGNINQTANLPAGGSVTYTAIATISGSATGSMSNTATVATNGTEADPSLTNNSATDTDTLAPASIQFSGPLYREDESQTATIMITRTIDTSGLSTVEFTAAPGSAPTATGGGIGTCGSAGIDFETVTGQTVTFNPGDTEKPVTVKICGGDTVQEIPDENIALSLGNPTGAGLGSQASAVLKINDTASQYLQSPVHTPIDMFLGAIANPYPSTITVTGAPMMIGSMRVTLYDVSHANPMNMDVLLVGPGGQKYLLVADTGGTLPVSPDAPVTLTFSDFAGSHVPAGTPWTTGQFLPTVCESNTTAFPVPAPGFPYVTPNCTTPNALAQTMFGSPGTGFGLTNPNGVWSLYVRDDAGNMRPAGEALNSAVGRIAGGWGLEFLAPTAADVSIAGRVLTADGRGVRGAFVTVTGNSLASPITVMAGVNGRYTIPGLTAGETYVLTVRSRRFVFDQPSRVISLTDNVADADFIAAPNTSREQ